MEIREIKNKLTDLEDKLSTIGLLNLSFPDIKGSKINSLIEIILFKSQ